MTPPFISRNPLKKTLLSNTYSLILVTSYIHFFPNLSIFDRFVSDKFYLLSRFGRYISVYICNHSKIVFELSYPIVLNVLANFECVIQKT